MRAVVMTATLHFPMAGSLKDRRQSLQSIRDMLVRRFGASVAQTGDKAKWQSAELTIAIACEHEGTSREKAAAVRRFLENGEEHELSHLDEVYV
jgi:uncharacterized protein YlxP (DUF503 family)